jgi:hypothetical protein
LRKNTLQRLRRWIASRARPVIPSKGAECDGRGRRAIANLARRPITGSARFFAAPLLQQEAQHGCSKMSDFKRLSARG